MKNESVVYHLNSYSSGSNNQYAVVNFEWGFDVYKLLFLLERVMNAAVSGMGKRFDL